jgi:hypothetical protein
VRYEETTFSDKETAEAYSREEQAYFLSRKVCPLMNSKCSSDCVCFVKPLPSKTRQQKKYRIEPWGCSNPMLGQGANNGKG